MIPAEEKRKILEFHKRAMTVAKALGGVLYGFDQHAERCSIVCDGHVVDIPRCVFAYIERVESEKRGGGK